jgi:hypothetical protein
MFYFKGVWALRTIKYILANTAVPEVKLNNNYNRSKTEMLNLKFLQSALVFLAHFRNNPESTSLKQNVTFNYKYIW